MIGSLANYIRIDVIPHKRAHLFSLDENHKYFPSIPFINKKLTSYQFFTKKKTENNYKNGSCFNRIHYSEYVRLID